MKIVNLKDIKDLLPSQSWLNRHFDSVKQRDDNWKALLIVGNFEIEHLNLDDLSSCFPQLTFANEELYVLLCTGNLKAINLFNENTDGSSGLIVLGDLSCTNMVVGGQEIFVGGRLLVRQCFWGDYNHGSLLVTGNLTARLFVVTEGYHFENEKTNLTADYFLVDEEVEDDDFDMEAVTAVFNTECIAELDDWEEEVNSWSGLLNRFACIERLAKGLPLLKDHWEITDEPEPPIEKIFDLPETLLSKEDWNKQIPNFIKLRECCSLEQDNILGFEQYGWTFTIHQAYKDDPNTFIITALNTEYGFVISYTLEKTGTNGYDSYVYLLNTKEEKGVFLFEVPDRPEPYCRMVKEVWNALLYHAEQGVHYFRQYLSEVKPEEITGFCTLPIITQKYNDWNDGDKNGFYKNGKDYSFRIPGEQRGTAQLRITREIPTQADEEYDCRGYRFINDGLEDAKRVELFYNFSQNETIEGRYKDYGGTRVYFFDDALYAEALRWFRRAKKIIPGMNESFLKHGNDGSEL